MQQTHYEQSEAEAIQGLTHPNKVLLAAANMFKRRGALTATVRSNWVERLFVLTENALFWFDKEYGVMGAQHGRIELRHIQSLRPLQSSERPSVTVNELESLGPRYQLEVSHIMSDHVCLFGCTDQSIVQAWQDTLERAVAAATSASSGSPPAAEADGGASPACRSLATSLASSGHSVVQTSSLLRLELTGVTAIGVLGKARQALTGHMKTGLGLPGVGVPGKEGRPRDGWSTRVVVLTESSLHFFKPINRHHMQEDEGPAWGGFGSTLRTGEPIFGREVRRRPRRCPPPPRPPRSPA